MHRKKQLTKKALEARMQDLLNEPTAEDLEQLRQFKEHMLDEKARAIIEQQRPNGKWRLDGESRKEEASKQFAEWNN